MKKQMMGDLIADYEAELIALELANRPADMAQRAATIQREINAGLRDAEGHLILNGPEECQHCGEHHYPDESCIEDEEEEDDENDEG